MEIICPSQNTIWFWFDKTSRRKFHGTLDDAARKMDAFHVREYPLEGFEIFIMPSRLPAAPGQQIAPDFASRFRSLKYRCVHIGETEHDFLIGPETPVHLTALRRLLDFLEAQRIVVHAHHLAEEPEKAVTALVKNLPGTDILVENNGFDNAWGSEPTNVRNLFATFTELLFCLDTTHVDDFEHLRMEQFTRDDLLRSKLREIHTSYSTRLLGYDPYESRGYHGYNPYHALFSVLDEQPDDEAREVMAEVPVVMEGIVPPEDENLEFLVRERDLLEKFRNGAGS